MSVRSRCPTFALAMTLTRGDFEEDKEQGIVALLPQRLAVGRMQQVDHLALGQRRRCVLLYAWRAHGLDVAHPLPGDEPPLAELLVGAAQRGQRAGDEAEYLTLIAALTDLTARIAARSA